MCRSRLLDFVESSAEVGDRLLAVPVYLSGRDAEEGSRVVSAGAMVEAMRSSGSATDVPARGRAPRQIPAYTQKPAKGVVKPTPAITLRPTTARHRGVTSVQVPKGPQRTPEVADWA